MTVSPAGAAGHASVVGAPLGQEHAAAHAGGRLALPDPAGEQFYVLDFGGGTFARSAGLPHVAGVGTRSEPDVVRRIVAEVKGIVDAREAYFRAEGIDSIETYRSAAPRARADDG